MNLDAKADVLDTDETPSDGKVIVVLQLIRNGKAVQAASNIAISCNGVSLPFNGLLFGHAERVPLVPAGGVYVFRYSRAGTTSQLSVTVPGRPVFAPPTTAGASLPRTTNFVIHYVPGGGTSVRGDASDGTHSMNNAQSDDGTHDGLDVSGFNPGPGTLSIVRTLEGAASGTGFHSAATKYDTGRRIPIAWQ